MGKDITDDWNEVVDDVYYEIEYIPPWAVALSDGSFDRVGTQLCTKDGRRVGNAFILETNITLHGVDGFYKICTDAGTVLNLLKGELKEFFHEPLYVMDIEEAKAKFMREE